MPHGHSHGCCAHEPKDFGRAFMFGILLNTLFIIAEVIWGLKANSLALLADAGHNASDVLALAIAWGASSLGKRQPSARFTYGMRGSSIIASLANAVMLLVVVGGIGWESLMRLAQPVPSEGYTIIVVAAIGVLINGATALFFLSGRKGDINIRGAYLHMVADAAISLGVVVSGFLFLKTGWLWLDPVASLAIAGIIIIGTWGLLVESVEMALHAVPKGIDLAAVKDYLRKTPGVSEVHDLHIWSMSTTEIASSMHIVTPKQHPGDGFIRDIAQRLQREFGITHTTVQIEIGDTGTDCPFAPDHVV